MPVTDKRENFMTSRTTYRIQSRLLTWPTEGARAFSNWLEEVSHRIDAAMPVHRHRMGSWEASASLRARALQQVAEKDVSTR